jgi:hypothetical protein
VNSFTREIIARRMMGWVWCGVIQGNDYFFSLVEVSMDGRIIRVCAVEPSVVSLSKMLVSFYQAVMKDRVDGDQCVLK